MLARAALLAALLCPSPARADCTTFIAGREATADGSVLLAHNEDLGNNAAQHYLVVPREHHDPGEVVTLWGGAEIPEVGETFGYIATTVFDIDFIPGDITTGINEHQVMVANNLAYQRSAISPAPTDGRVLWTEFTRLALERAATAREAVLLIGQLSEDYGLGGDPGTLFGVADPDEGWWVEVTQAGPWVAERVPDDAVSVRANTWRIGAVDLTDSDRFLGSADLVSFAEARGWYDPEEGPFDFVSAYGDPHAIDATWNTHREARVLALLGARLPAIRPEDAQAALRDHYEGTDQDLTDGYREGSPHHTPERTLCVLSTEIASVCVARAWLAPEVGGLCWRALATPCSSVFVPWYLGQDDVPTPYTLGTDEPTVGSAYWAFRDLGTTVDGRYRRRIGATRELLGALEEAEREAQPALEEQAEALLADDPAAARALLTEASDAWAAEAVAAVAALLEAGFAPDPVAPAAEGGCRCATPRRAASGLPALLFAVLLGLRRRVARDAAGPVLRP